MTIEYGIKWESVDTKDKKKCDSRESADKVSCLHLVLMSPHESSGKN